MTQEALWEDAELVKSSFVEKTSEVTEKKCKQDAIVKIKEMAGAVGISLSIHG